MLKRLSKLVYNRKPEKIYQLNMSNLQKSNEEEKREEDMS